MTARTDKPFRIGIRPQEQPTKFEPTTVKLGQDMGTAPSYGPVEAQNPFTAEAVPWTNLRDGKR